MTALLRDVENTGCLESSDLTWVTPHHLLLTMRLRTGSVVEVGSAHQSCVVWIDALGPSTGDRASVISAVKGLCSQNYAVEHKRFRTILSINRERGGAPHRLIGGGHKGQTRSPALTKGASSRRQSWLALLLTAGYVASCLGMLGAGFTFPPLLMLLAVVAYVLLVALSSEGDTDQASPPSPDGHGRAQWRPKHSAPTWRWAGHWAGCGSAGRWGGASSSPGPSSSRERQSSRQRAFVSPNPEPLPDRAAENLPPMRNHHHPNDRPTGRAAEAPAPGRPTFGGTPRAGRPRPRVSS